jgi:hypothetical protein
MDKRAIGKARAEKLDAVLSDLLDQDDNALRNMMKSDLFKKEGTFHLGRLAKLVGLDCEAATFRQNKALREKVDEAHASILARKVLTEAKGEVTSRTKKAIGEQNEVNFLEWLVNVGTVESPAPVSHAGRLYRKALWATYSGQELLDVEGVPTWFNSRAAVKDALNQLDVKVVRKSVVTIQMDADSIADDMECSMTSALIRKLRAEVKALKEKLAAEREARQKAELEAKQNEWQAGFVETGKMPHKQ